MIGTALLFYALMLPKSRAGSDTPGAIGQLEQSIELFAEEIDRENHELILLISNMRKQQEESIARLERRMGELEKHSAVWTSQHRSAEIVPDEIPRTVGPEPLSAQDGMLEPAYPSSQTVQDEAKLSVCEEEGSRIRSRYNELFGMYDAGKSVDYIARKLNMNRGEISLILQLAKQEERLHA